MSASLFKGPRARLLAILLCVLGSFISAGAPVNAVQHAGGPAMAHQHSFVSALTAIELSPQEDDAADGSASTHSHSEIDNPVIASADAVTLASMLPGSPAGLSPPPHNWANVPASLDRPPKTTVIMT